MGPFTDITTVFVKTFKFSGRASRSEYWWYTLFYNVIIMVCGFVDVAMIIDLVQQEDKAAIEALSIFDYTSTFAWILTISPVISLTVRRLHDAGFSGFWALLFFIPLGIFALLVMHMLPSRSGTSVHGTPASGPVADRTGKPMTVDSHKRAMQGYAVLFDKDKPVTAEMQAARKAEVADYYRSRVLKASPSA